MKQLAVMTSFLLLLCVRGSANTNVLDILVDMEGNTAGQLVTAARMDNASHVNGALGSWSVNNTATLTFTNSRNATPRGPVIVNSTAYTGSGNTFSMALDLKQNIVREYARYTLGTGRAKLSVGFAFRYSSANTTDFWDLFALEGGAQFMVLNLEDRAVDNSRIGLETDVCTSDTQIGYKTISDDTYYWVTMQWNKNASCLMQVYNMSTWRTLFATNCSIGNANCTDIYIGRYDNHGGNSAANQVYYDNLLVDVTGNTYPLLPVGATVTAASCDFADVNEAYTNAVAGTNRFIMDTVQLPAGSSATWTTGITINKAGIVIAGMGTNASGGSIINFSQDHGDAPFQLGTSNIDVKAIQFSGPTAADLQAEGIHMNAGSDFYRIYSNYFKFCMVFNEARRGLIYKNYFQDGDRMGRVWGGGTSGQTMYDNFYPWDPSSTNMVVFEDNIFVTTSALNTGALLAISSQAGQIWMCRNCSFDFAKGDIAPVFDVHGPTGGGVRGNIGVIVCSNYVNFHGTATWDFFVDVRGGRALIETNVVVGRVAGGNRLRRKDGTDAALYFENGGIEQCTNVYICNNTTNGGDMTLQIGEDGDAENDAAVITLNQSYFLSCTSETMPAYPLSYRHDATVQGGGGTVGPTGGRRIRANVRIRP